MADLVEVVGAQRERAKTLIDLAGICTFYYRDFDAYNEKAAKKAARKRVAKKAKKAARKKVARKAVKKVDQQLASSAVRETEIQERIIHKQHWLPWVLLALSLLALVVCWLV